MTPGLRREEVADLAGVGTTWYTWLEQARDIRPSERTLRSIARALQLDKLETKYLLDLALEHAPRPAGEERVASEVMSILNGMSSPGFVVGRAGDLLAYNRAANAVFDFEYVPDRNYFRTLFSQEMRALLANWPEYSRNMVRILRRRSAEILGDPAMAGLVDDLSRHSHEFREWWAEQSLSDQHTYPYPCVHPFVGRLELEISCFSVFEHPDLRIVSLVTEQHETGQRMAELLRQLERGEHDERHNLWAALASQQSLSAAQGYLSGLR